MAHFTRRGAQRIARQVKDAERRPLPASGVPRRARPNTFMLGGSGGTAIRAAKAPSTGIPARVGVACGSGTIEFYDDSDPANFILSGDTATAYNDYPDADVSPNAFLKVYQRSGVWWVLTDQCDTSGVPTETMLAPTGTGTGLSGETTPGDVAGITVNPGSDPAPIGDYSAPDSGGDTGGMDTGTGTFV